MAHRAVLTARQRATLFDLPTDEANILSTTRYPMMISNTSMSAAATETDLALPCSYAPCGIQGVCSPQARLFPQK
ncbi:hypothetical protein AB838_15955 [Rhodobacteraceae bacterium (ex Bugula neritina AB1)]|nr:hypothetical protein AB838_15955 [Rhodobacteraceae bacterium (ex Bugula neritina AB1)]